MNTENASVSATEATGYLEDLWRRLNTIEPGVPREGRSDIKAQLEIEKISDPLFIAKAKAFVEPKLKGKPELNDLSAIRSLLAALLRSPVAAEARGWLIELFQRPKISLKLRSELVQAATDARTAGITEQVLPLFQNSANGYLAAQYFTVVPDPVAVDALGRYYLEQALAGKGSDLFTLQALEANCSPQLLKYVVPVLEQERRGKSDNDIIPRMGALHLLGRIGDVSQVPLVMKEMQNYSDRSTISTGLSALAGLPDERVYEEVVKVVSNYIKKYYEAKKAEPSPLDIIFSRVWPYFQKVGRDHAPEMMALLHRLAVPEVWELLSEEDKDFLEAQYRATVAFPDSEMARQRLAAVYRDETRFLSERVQAFGELLDTFKEHMQESAVKKYFTPEAEIITSSRDGWVGEGGVQFVDLRLIGPDGAKHLVQIRRSQKRNAVTMIIKNARF